MAPIVDVWIVSFPRDYEWLRYCVRSIHKLFHGWNQLHIALPHAAPQPRLDGRWSRENEAPGFKDGYIGQQITKLRAYRDTDADYLCYIDSDHVCLRPTQVTDYFAGGRPVLWYRTWDQVAEIPAGTGQAWEPGVTATACRWRPIVEQAMGAACPYFTLEFLPLIFHRRTVMGTCKQIEEAHGCSLEEYARKQPRRAFSEFICLGNYALRCDADMAAAGLATRYEARCAHGVHHAFRFAGHNPYEPIPPAKRAELEALLA